MEKPLITRPRVALFDFDLTLADSTRAAAICIDHALVQLGFDPVGPERARRTIGLSLERTLASLTDETDSAKQARFRAHFMEKADLVMVSETDLLEGVRSTLDRLLGLGMRLGIVSTKYRFRIEDILDRYQIRDRFDVIVGGEDVTAHKPDPEGLTSALVALEAGGHEALYAGDHVVDAEAAMRGAVPFVGVLSGETGEEELSRFPHLGIIGSVAELPALLSG